VVVAANNTTLKNEGRCSWREVGGGGSGEQHAPENKRTRSWREVAQVGGGGMLWVVAGGGGSSGRRHATPRKQAHSLVFKGGGKCVLVSKRKKEI